MIDITRGRSAYHTHVVHDSSMTVFVKRREILVGGSEFKSDMQERPNKPQLRGVSLLVLETQCEHEGKKYASTVKVQSKENKGEHGHDQTRFQFPNTQF